MDYKYAIATLNKDGNVKETFLIGEFCEETDFMFLEEIIMHNLLEAGYMFEGEVKFITNVQGYNIIIPMEVKREHGDFSCSFKGEASLFFMNLFDFLRDGVLNEKLGVMAPCYMLGRYCDTRHDIECGAFYGEMPVCYFTEQTINKILEEVPEAKHVTDVFFKYDYTDCYGNDFANNFACIDKIDWSSEELNIFLCDFGRVRYPGAVNNELYRDDAMVYSQAGDFVITYKNKTQYIHKFCFSSAEDYLKKIKMVLAYVLSEEDKNTYSPFNKAFKTMKGE